MRFTGAAVLLIPLLLASAVGAQETRMVPVAVDGQSVRLEMRAPGIAERQPMTRPPMTRMTSPVT